MSSHGWHNLSQDDRAQFWATLALKHTQGIGPRLAVRILRHFGSAYAAIHGLDEWQGLGIKSSIISSVSAGAWRESALIEWKNAQACAAHIVLWHDDAYPPLLKTTIDAPVMFYAFGDLGLLMGPCLAIVGSRKCTPQGIETAAKITRDLSAAGITIVSGMAKGIDKVAHVAALHGIGKSIAVLGTGIDVIYPKGNTDVYYDLSNSGLIMSEYAPKTPPLAANFPIRNRIISGISLGVLVVEGTLRSGTLITARQALEQNRDVFAIPGIANALTSQGCQELIRQGAKVVFTAEDILCDIMEQLKSFSATFEKITSEKSPEELTSQDENTYAVLTSEVLQNFSKAEQEDVSSILKYLHGHGESHTDAICMHLAKPANEVNSLLMNMELLSLIKRLHGSRYIAKSSLA